MLVKVNTNVQSLHLRVKSMGYVQPGVASRHGCYRLDDLVVCVHVCGDANRTYVAPHPFAKSDTVTRSKLPVTNRGSRGVCLGVLLFEYHGQSV